MNGWRWVELILVILNLVLAGTLIYQTGRTIHARHEWEERVDELLGKNGRR